MAVAEPRSEGASSVEPLMSGLEIHIKKKADGSAALSCRGFYGLVALGWDLSDFGKPWPRGPLPDETLVLGFSPAATAA